MGAQTNTNTASQIIWGIELRTRGNSQKGEKGGGRVFSFLGEEFSHLKQQMTLGATRLSKWYYPAVSLVPRREGGPLCIQIF